MPVAAAECVLKAPDAWFNTADYSVPLLVLFGVGCVGWVVAYVAIVRNALRNRFLEIPAGAVVANIAWEFVWGFLYPNELGRFVLVGLPHLVLLRPRDRVPASSSTAPSRSGPVTRRPRARRRRRPTRPR